MQKTASSAWVTKAGSFLAFGSLLGQSAPAMANGWTAPATPLPNPVHALSLARTSTTGAVNQTFASLIHSQGAATGAGLQSTANLLSAQSQAGVLASLSHHTASINPANATAAHKTAWQMQTPAVFNAPVHTGSLFNASLPSGVAGPGLQLDLTSGNANIVLGSSLFSGTTTATIVVGGKALTFGAGSSVTPAEYIAVRQILGGAAQTLIVNGGGAATGGNFRLDAAAGAQVGEIVVPRNVVALNFANSSNNPTVSGDIVNFGTIYGLTSRGSTANVTLNALDILNERGATITTDLSAAMVRALGGVLAGSGLTLTAGDTIANSGTISSKGDISLSSGSGNIFNAGLVASSAGNITLTSANPAAPITVNASSGTFSALKGDISVRDASYAGTANVALIGGDYLSRNLNVYAGAGEIDGNVGQLTGRLNTVAGIDHLQAATANLILGNNSVSGDPTFVNTSGNIVIDGKNVFSEDVAILANGDITADTTGQIIASGHNITLVSGIPFSGVDNSNDSPTIGGVGSKASLSNVSFIVPTAPTSADIGIDLSKSTAVNVLDSSSTSGNAGNITFVSFNGSVYTASNSIINAQAGGSGNGGLVTIIAPGAAQPKAVSIGSVLTGGGSAGGTGGAISIVASLAQASDNSTQMTFDTHGDMTQGTSFKATTPLDVNFSSSTILVNGNLVTAAAGQTNVVAGIKGANAGAITVLAAGDITTSSLLAFGGGGAGGSATTLNGGAGGSGAPISVGTIDGTIRINGDVNSSGGGGGGAGGNGSAGGSGGVGGAAGAINIATVPTSTTVGSSKFDITAFGNVYASSGGSGGNSSAGGAGGGGASYGGGGGGGSATDTSTNASAAAGGGAGYFGGGGGYAEVATATNSPGGGGGFTGGSAGGATANAGTSMAGGDGSGVLASNAAASGGQRNLPGAGAGGTVGGVIPTAKTSGNDVDISSPITIVGGASGTGTVTLGGAVTGRTVAITSPDGVTFNGNVVATNSLTINAAAREVKQASNALFIDTPSLTVNSLASGTLTLAGVGSQGVALATDASNITLSGAINDVYIKDNGPSLTLNNTLKGSMAIFSLAMTAPGASITVQNSLPASIATLIITTDSTLNTGGTISFLGATNITTGSLGSVNLQANEIDFPGTLTINADSTNSFGGGVISVTTNKINGKQDFTLGNASGQLSLSARGINDANTIGGAGGITLNAPNSSVIFNPGSVDVSYVKTGVTDPTAVVGQGAGGKIILNVGNLTSASPIALNADGYGSGNGGTISITLNSTATQNIGTGNGEFSFSAKNGPLSAAGSNAFGGSASITTLGNLLVAAPVVTLNVIQDNGGNVNGGSIALKANQISAAGGGLLTITNDGFASGFGGKISITETQANLNAKLGNAAGDDFYLVAQGGGNTSANGSVAVTTTGNIYLTSDATTGNVLGTNMSAVVGASGSNGGGGSLSLTANSILNLTTPGQGMTFNAVGTGTGFGGTIKLTVSDNQSINIGKDLNSGQFQFNVANGAMGIVAGSVGVTVGSLTDTTGTGTLTLDPAAIVEQVVSKTNANINGGGLLFIAPTIITASTVSSKTALILNASGAGKASGGNITFAETAPNSVVTIGTKPTQVELLAAAGKSGGSGGTILANSGGNLIVNVAGLSAKASGATGNGGRISLSATNANDDALYGNLQVVGTLSVNAGSAKAQGGTINLFSNSPTNTFNIGLTKNNPNGVEGGLSASGVSSINGQGGNIGVTTAGSKGIVVQKALTAAQFFQFNYAAGASGDFDLDATIGSTKTSQILITPTDSNPGTASNIIASKAGKLVVAMTGVGFARAGNILLQAAGNIEGPTTIVKGVATTARINIVAPELTATTTTGDIDINAAISAKSLLTVDSVNAGGNVDLFSKGGLTTAGFLPSVQNLSQSNQKLLATPNAAAGGGGSGSISSGGNVSLGAQGQLSGSVGNTQALQILTVKSLVKIDADLALSVYAIPINPKNGQFLQATGGQGPVGNGPSPQFKSNAIVHDSTPPVYSHFVVGGDGKGSLSIDCDHSVIMTGSGFAGITDLTISSSAPGGSVSGPGILEAKTVTVQTFGGNIGTSSAPLQINAPVIAVNTGTGSSTLAGTAYVDSINTGTVTVTSSRAGGYNLTTAAGAKVSGVTTGDGGINITAAKTLIVDSLSSSGPVTVTGGGTTTIGSITTTGATGDITLETTTGVLQTSLNARVQAVNAKITFENLNASKGSIVVAAGSNIETGNGVDGVGGNVVFTIGDLGATVPGTTPAKNVTVTPNQTGTVYWGTNSITANASKGVGNTLTAKGADIIFNTGALKATAIKLNGNTTITADPPGASAASSNPAQANIIDAAAPAATPAAEAASNPTIATTAQSPISTQPLSGGVTLQVVSNNPTLSTPSLINTQAVQIQTAASTNVQPSAAADTDARWISESEIEAGLIPANLITDGKFALPSEVSSVFDYAPTTHELKRGSAVFAPQQDVVVKTPYGPLTVAAKSVVLVLCLQDSLAVYNFDDSHRGSVSVTVGGEKIAIAPGKHLLVSAKKARSFEEINAAQAFTYRGLQNHQVQDGERTLQIFTADFNHCQAIGAVMPLRKLIKSDDAGARAIGQRLIKTSAILSQVTAGGEAYRMMPKPRVIASR